MQRARSLLVFSSLLSASIGLALVACGDDDAVVRERPDSGAADGSVSGDASSDAEGGLLACGVTVPTTFDATNYTTNAAVELALKEHLEDIESKMREAEGVDAGAPTANDVSAIFSAGTPSLRAVSTSNAQTLVDEYIADFGAAVGKTWTPQMADADGGAATGGAFNADLFGPTGVDLRETTVKVLLTGALYNHALGIVSAPLTPTTPDRLLAIFGASPSLANRTDADAGDQADELVAEYASRRDNDAAPTGPYRKIKQALLTLKATIPAGDKCKKETDDAIATYLAEWEKASLATSIFYLNSAVTNAAAADKDRQALHAFGEASGFIQGWKGIPQDKRKITDAQLDALLTKIGADSPYKLVIDRGTRGLALNGAINDIAIIYGFSAAEVEAFKTNF